jgi:hypothetical protein
LPSRVASKLFETFASLQGCGQLVKHEKLAGVGFSTATPAPSARISTSSTLGHCGTGFVGDTQSECRLSWHSQEPGYVGAFT